MHAQPLILTTMLLLGGLLSGAEDRQHRDLAYVPMGHERQRLDLYLPDLAGGKPPLVVYIHGGAWKAGSKENRQGGFLLKHGYALASINYRLSQHAIFPAQIEDCKAAIRWLRANAAAYGYDAERIGVWGPSAGGHLAALLGATNGVKDFDQGPNIDTSSQVQCVIDFYGPTDLLRMDEQLSGLGPQTHNGVNSPESLLLGGPLPQMRELAAEANPITYLSGKTAQYVPPYLIVHGDRDPTVPIGQSHLLAAALGTAKIAHQLHVIPGAGHGGKPFQEQPVIDLITVFLAQHLKEKAK